MHAVNIAVNCFFHISKFVGESVCIFADKLIGEQQVVVKPFPAYLNKYNIKGEGPSGCTIMGDGSISLIIDTNTLIG